jgi:hypothetical protein
MGSLLEALYVGILYVEALHVRLRFLLGDVRVDHRRGEVRVARGLLQPGGCFRPIGRASWRTYGEGYAGRSARPLPDPPLLRSASPSASSAKCRPESPSRSEKATPTPAAAPSTLGGPRPIGSRRRRRGLLHLSPRGHRYGRC